MRAPLSWLDSEHPVKSVLHFLQIALLVVEGSETVVQQHIRPVKGYSSFERIKSKLPLSFGGVAISNARERINSICIVREIVKHCLLVVLDGEIVEPKTLLETGELEVDIAEMREARD